MLARRFIICRSTAILSAMFLTRCSIVFNTVQLDRPHTIPCDAPHDAVTTSCSVRPSVIPSVTIVKIGGNRRPSQRFEHVQRFLRECILSQENTIVQGRRNGFVIGGAKRKFARQNIFFNYTFISKGYDFVH